MALCFNTLSASWLKHTHPLQTALRGIALCFNALSASWLKHAHPLQTALRGIALCFNALSAPWLKHTHPTLASLKGHILCFKPCLGAGQCTQQLRSVHPTAQVRFHVGDLRHQNAHNAIFRRRSAAPNLTCSIHPTLLLHSPH